MLLEISGEISRKNEGMEPKQKQYPVVDMTGDKSKVRCCKEQYCTGTWNVRSMNQGKLEVNGDECIHVRVVRHAHLRGGLTRFAADKSDGAGC